MSLTPGPNPLGFQYPADEIPLVIPDEDLPGLRKIELVSLAASACSGKGSEP